MSSNQQDERVIEEPIVAIPMPEDTPPYVQALVDKIFRASIGEKPDGEWQLAARVMAFFFIMCGYIGSITDDERRNSFVHMVCSRFTRDLIEDSRKAVLKTVDEAAARGMTPHEMMQAEADEGLADVIPYTESPSEH